MRRLLLIPIALAVLTGVDLPETAPVPVENPRKQVEPETPAPPAAEQETRTKPETKPAPPSIDRPHDEDGALAACEMQLRGLGVTFNREEPVIGENGCGIDAAYSVSEIAPGVTLKPASQLRCDTVLALARWTADVVQPAMKALPGDVTLTSLSHGSTYVCRRRNNASAGKMSEHAIGNAIDVTTLTFDGHDPLTIVPRAGKGTIEEAFQRAIRAGACLYFTTVLGPGADAHHDDHLHLDIAKRRSDYRLCQ